MSPSPLKKSWLDYLIPSLQVISTLVLFIFPQTFSDEGTKFLGISEDSVYWNLIKIISVAGMLFGIAVQLIVAYLAFMQSTKIAILNETVEKLESEKSDVDIKLLETESKKKQIEEGINEDFYALANALCLIMANELGFGSQPGVYERISFYTYDKTVNCFKLLSRYSDNTELNSIGEDDYQKNVGNIGKVWKNNFLYANDYPEIKPDNKTDLNRYIRRAMKDGLTKDQVESLRMKAHLYAGQRICDSKRIPLAVVMLEATSSTRWEKGFLKKYFEQENHRLTTLFEIIYPKAPDISSARIKGF